MESDPLLVRAELKLKKQADKLVVLADSSKIGARSNMIVCPLVDVDMVITDEGIRPEDRAMFEQAGVEVVKGKAIWKGSDVILKVRGVNEAEAKLLKAGQTLISFFWPAQNEALMQQLADAKANVIA